MHTRLLIFLLMPILSPLSLAAQAWQPSAPTLPIATFDLDQSRIPVAELKGSVHIHLGDDPDGKLGWARPDFDDSKWQLVEIGKYWSESGIRDPGGWGHDGRGMGWMRFRMKLPKKHGRLALYFRMCDSACQIFANGQYVDQVGFMPPHEAVNDNVDFIVPLPESLGDEVVIAVRFWHCAESARYLGGGFDKPPLLGDAAWLSRYRTTVIQSGFWYDAAKNFEILMLFVSGVIGAGLFLARRKEREYLYFSVSQLLSVVGMLIFQAGTYLTLDGIITDRVAYLFFLVATLLWLQFLYTLIGARRDGWFWIAVGISALDVFLQIAQIASLPFAVWLILDTRWSPAIVMLVIVPARLAAVIVLARGARRRNLDAILLLIPSSIDLLEAVVENVLVLGYHAGLFSWAANAYAGQQEITQWPFRITVSSTAAYIELLFVLLVLVLRFARSSREQERLRNEFEAARTVQQVLVPEEIPAIPGFSVQAVYHPAGEVGGDFYQVVPTPGGGLLAIIGDVSGKGMSAAMTVSLLVGTFRTLAHYTQDPAEILAAMNQRLQGRANGGFATALTLRLDRDGTLTAANAGHISPYANGKELEVENGLPLGITSAAAYGNSTLRLEARTSLTLLSDGVVEAQNAKGELFGFERTAAASNEPAEKLAQAAQTFGQSDDITVLSLALVAGVS